MPLRVGDTLHNSSDPRGEKVLGFVVEHDDRLGLSSGVDSSEDYVLSEPHGLGRRVRLYQDVLERGWIATGGDPLSDVVEHEVHQGWAQRFEDALTFSGTSTSSGHPWAWLAMPLIQRAHRDGYHLLPVGGFVRDILRGAEPRDVEVVDDLDMAGTVPTVQFRRFVFDFLLEHSGYEPWRRETFPILRTSPTQVVHLSTLEGLKDSSSFAISKEPVIQYAMLKADRVTLRGHAAQVLGGTEFVVDAQWRDVGYNCLFYDPIRQLIIDPGGMGLEDLGLSPALLKQSPDEALGYLKPPRVAPHDVPDFPDVLEHGKLWMNAVIRVVKQVHEFGERADYSQCKTWFARHRDLFTQILRGEETGSQCLNKLKAGLKQLHDKQSSAPSRQELESALGPDFIWMLDAVADSHRSRSEVGGGPRLLLTGYALAQVIGERAPFRIAAPEGPEDLRAEAASRYFQHRIAGYEHVVVEVEFCGRVFTALGLADPLHFGPTYVEMANNAPIPADDKVLHEVITLERQRRLDY